MAWEIIAEVIVRALVEGAAYSLLAVGLTLIFGAMRVLNIAHGDLAVLGAYICYWLLVIFHIDVFIGLLFVVPLMFLIGWGVQKFIINPAVSIPQFQVQASYIITYGLALFISNQELIAWTADYRSLTVAYSYLSISVLGVTINAPRLAVLSVTVIVSALYMLFLRTRLGRAIRACTQDREAALLMGINFNKLAGFTFGISAATAAVGGMLFALTYTLYPAVGLQLTIKAVTVMIFGGIGSVGGALAAGLLLGITEALVTFVVGATYKDLVAFMLLVIILLIRPTGIVRKEFFLPK